MSDSEITVTRDLHMPTLQSCWLTQGAWCEPCSCTALVGEAKQLVGARINGEERGGTRRQKLKEERKGGSRLLYFSAPWGTAGKGRVELGELYLEDASQC